MHKQKRSKTLPILLTILLALGFLSSCGDPGPSEPAQAAPEPSPVSSLAAEPTPEPTIEHSGECTVRFIDVGQADAALITCDGESMLIDGGNREDSSRMYSILEQLNISHLKYVVATHAHEDHIGGIPGALQKASADMVFSPVTQYDSKTFENFKTAADANGGIVVPNAGDTYPLGSAQFTILGVNSDPTDTNNTSIVLRLVYGDTSFLFTGDAERETEQILLNSGCELQSNVLKVGHHGSETSTTYPFLREVMPQYAVISCGQNNQYGHPDESTLSKLRDAEAKLFRTDLQGDILCTSNGKELTWETAKNSDIETNPTAPPTAAPTPEPAPKPTPEPVRQQVTETPQNPQNPPAPAPAVSSDGSYIGNINTKKVHRPSCGSLPQEKNRVYFSNLDDALNQGYVRCKKCF